MAKPVYCLLGLALVLSAPNALAWDDKSISSKTLNQLCQAGVMGNSINGRGSGYMMYTLRGRMMVGNMTIADYNNVQKWFKSNCPDGW